jgi:hypothetical protein
VEPTNKLRWKHNSVSFPVVEYFSDGEITSRNEYTNTYTTNVLQQWWTREIEGLEFPFGGEWRDVPVETE